MLHVCSVEQRGSESCLPPLPHGSSWWRKKCRNLTKMCMVSDKHPRVIEYYRGTVELMKARSYHAKHVYLIHPLSRMKQYLKWEFWILLLSSLPTDVILLIYPNMIVKYIHVLRITTILRIGPCKKYLDNLTAGIYYDCAVFSIVKHSLLSFLILHWSACIYRTLPRWKYVQFGHYLKDSYMIKSGMTNVSRNEQYILSIFDCAGFLLSAHADENTKSKILEERLYVTILLIVGKLHQVTVSVLTISYIFDKYSIETKYQAIMNQLEEYIGNKKFPPAMRNRIVQHYEYKFQKKCYKANAINNILSDSLKKEINVNVCRLLAYRVDLLSDLPSQALSQLLNSLEMEMYLPNDVIMKSGVVGDRMYFILSGTAAVYTPSGREVYHLHDGDYFGEVALLVDEVKRMADVVALEICEIYSLDRKAFKAYFKSLPMERQKKMIEYANERLERNMALEEEYKSQLFHKAYRMGYGTF